MDHPTQPGGIGKTLFLIIIAVIALTLLLFLILRPGHAFASNQVPQQLTTEN